MKRRTFNLPNRMIVASTTGGPSSDSFYNYGPVPNGTEVTIAAGTLAEPSVSIYVTLKDHGYYNEISIIINMLNGATPVQKTVLFDYWNGDGYLTGKAISPCAITEVLNFTATYSGLDGVVADLKIQAKDSLGEFITIPGESITAYNYYSCYFQEITTKADLIELEAAGLTPENLYYCRSYREMEPLDSFQIEGYTKEDGSETVNKTFAVASLVRKIRIPGSAKPIAFDFFARETYD